MIRTAVVVVAKDEMGPKDEKGHPDIGSYILEFHVNQLTEGNEEEINFVHDTIEKL